MNPTRRTACPEPEWGYVIDSVSVRSVGEVGVKLVSGDNVEPDNWQLVLALPLVVAFSKRTPSRMVVFFGGAVLLGRYFEGVLAWGQGLDVSQGLLATVAVLAFIYAWAAEYVGGVAAITGSYLAGVLLTRTSFKRRIDEGIHPLTYSILVPVFLITIGLRANGRELGPHMVFTLALIAVAVVGKIVGSGGLAWMCGYSRLESLRVGLGMISRGEVGLIVAGYGLAHGVIGEDVFSASVLVVLATTMITPPLLRLAYPKAVDRPRIAVEEAFTAVPHEVHDAVGTSHSSDGHF